MKFKELLELHTLILTRIGRDYVKTWGPVHVEGVEPPPVNIRKKYEYMRMGAYYAFNYLEDDNEWYDLGPKDDLTYE